MENSLSNPIFFHNVLSNNFYESMMLMIEVATRAHSAEIDKRILEELEDDKADG